MTKMTAACIGVLLLATYVSTQGTPDNATMAMPLNHTTADTNSNATVVSTDPLNSASSNSTNPTGAATFLQSGAFSLLLPVAMAISLICNRC